MNSLIQKLNWDSNCSLPICWESVREKLIIVSETWLGSVPVNTCADCRRSIH